MSDLEKPNFFAIIPASVRYDKRLSPNAKLFFAEISSILNHNNRCYASNSYFARVFEISEVQVSRIIKQLIDTGHIIVDYKKDNTGTKRYIATNIYDKSTHIINDNTALSINVKHNKNSINNKLSTNVDNKRSQKKKSFVPPTLQEVIDYFTENGYSKQSAEDAFKYYDVGEWKDSKGNKVLNWKQKMRGVWFKNENKHDEDKQGSFIF